MPYEEQAAMLVALFCNGFATDLTDSAKQALRATLVSQYELGKDAGIVIGRYQERQTRRDLLMKGER